MYSVWNGAHQTTLGFSREKPCRHSSSAAGLYPTPILRERGPESGLLKWSRPARRIFNFIRASDYYPFQSPWPHGRSILDGREISVVSASLTREACSVRPGSVGETRGGRVKVACGDEWLWIDRLMVNGSYVAPDAVLKPGDRLKDSSMKVRSMPAEKDM